MMMNNFKIPFQLLKMLKGGNPQQVAMSMLQQNCKGNPMLENIATLANQGNGEAVTEVCKNIIKSKGLDPDELMRNFQNQIG